jgi:pimeloyl-ACP methyl ester carboxylesterase
MILSLAARYPGERFDIIAHSMGGVVALYTAATYPDVRERLRSILTINSPVQGIGEVREFFSSVLLPCLFPTENSAAVHDMDANGPVITTIKNTPWNSEDYGSLFVATIANACDAVVTNLLNGYPGADLGTLPNADFSNTFVADTGGCGPADLVNKAKLAYEHKAPLLVTSNSAASPTIDATLMSLVANWDLPVPFMGGNERLVTSLSPSQQQPLPLSTSFVANGDSQFNTLLTTANLHYSPQALTGAFVGNGTTQVESPLSIEGLGVAPEPLSASFVGNGDVMLSNELSSDALNYSPKQLTGSFVGNGDVNLSAPLTTIHIEPEPLSRAFVGSGNNVITALVKPRFQDIRCVYDANSSGTTERAEALSAVTSYLLSLTGITRDEAVEVVTSYLLSQSFEC